MGLPDWSATTTTPLVGSTLGLDDDAAPNDVDHMTAPFDSLRASSSPADDTMKTTPPLTAGDDVMPLPSAGLWGHALEPVVAFSATTLPAPSPKYATPSTTGAS